MLARNLNYIPLECTCLSYTIITAKEVILVASFVILSYIILKFHKSTMTVNMLLTWLHISLVSLHA